jgi:hypothetical protein
MYHAMEPVWTVWRRKSLSLMGINPKLMDRSAYSLVTVLAELCSAAKK